jgi:hypothetical protein
LLGIPRVSLVDSDNLVVLFGIDEDHYGGFFGLWHSIDIRDFHTQDISATSVPRNGLALTDIPKEIRFIRPKRLSLQSTESCIHRIGGRDI